MEIASNTVWLIVTCMYSFIKRCGLKNHHFGQLANMNVLSMWWCLVLTVGHLVCLVRVARGEEAEPGSLQDTQSGRKWVHCSPPVFCVSTVDGSLCAAPHAISLCATVATKSDLLKQIDELTSTRDDLTKEASCAPLWHARVLWMNVCYVRIYKDWTAFMPFFFHGVVFVRSNILNKSRNRW